MMAQPWVLEWSLLCEPALGWCCPARRLSELCRMEEYVDGGVWRVKIKQQGTEMPSEVYIYLSGIYSERTLFPNPEFDSIVP